MKTRRSLSNLETVAKTDGGDTPSKRKSLSKICRTPTSSKKEVNSGTNVTTTSESRVNLNSDGNSEKSLPPNVYNSPIVRILRSRVVTSDNEDEVKSTRTPKRRLSRGSLKEEKSFDSENDKTSAKAEAKKSPESGKKRLSRQNLFSIIEMEENEDTAKSVASIQDGKAAREIDSLYNKEEIISKDIIKEEDYSKTENVNKSKLRGNESVKSPGSARKRSSLLSESKETPSKAEEKEKTPKSSGKRSSFESEFHVNESENRVKTIESVSSVKDLEFKRTSSSLELAEQFNYKKSSMITSDNIGRDEGSSDTDEECITKERLTEENSSETESVVTKSKSEGKEIVGTPASARKRSSIIAENKETPSKECVDSKSKAMDKETERTPASVKKRSSIIMESHETPFRVEGKKGKTPKSSEKRFSFKGSFQVVEKDENEDRAKTIETVAALQDGDAKYAFSHTETAEELDSENSSVIEGDKFGLGGGCSDTNEENVTKDRIAKKKSSETVCVDTKSKYESKEREKTSSIKRSSLITGNEGTPSKVEGKKEKTPKSSVKRFSFQDSFKVVEMLEHGDSNDSHQENHERSTRISESEGSDSLSSKESEELEREEMGHNIKSEDKITDKGRKVKMSAEVSSGESVLQRAMVMTSLAIQKEKKAMKTPQKSEKMFVEAAPEEEYSEDSEEPQSEEMTGRMDVIEEDDTDSESDSDDDVPESISFDSGKEQMNRSVKMAVEAIQREKERIKEQRRKRMEMIRIQKKEKEQRQMEKLKMLEMKLPKRLSEDIVNRLPDTPEIPTIKDPAAKKKKKKNKVQVKDVEMVESKKNKITKFDDYIPLGDVKAATKFGIVPLDVMEKIPKSASEKAAEFKSQALFGSRIRREPSKNLISYKQKIGAAFKSKEANQQQRFKPY
ncbi:hypothetical protein J437_LFUL009012 [Ladona fulva]|uniref:Uncharacterized protein n=1 Tax=Ladona fulva TaxID=123851 RepID=A0A8K0K7Z5_LADFU|nr:hypothetical protein J437_LFUL009012 [Ladona fulva]